MIVQFSKLLKGCGSRRISKLTNLPIVSIAYLSFVILCWIIIAFVNGLNTRYMPTIGPDTSQVLGSVLFNYTLANTVPSWVNGTVSPQKCKVEMHVFANKIHGSVKQHPSVNLKRALWYSVIVATSLCKVMHQRN